MKVVQSWLSGLGENEHRHCLPCEIRFLILCTFINSNKIAKTRLVVLLKGIIEVTQGGGDNPYQEGLQSKDQHLTGV